MATSPNYAWAEPDNSSLVKNGAQDIRALGDAIDTSVWNIGYGQAGKNKIINGDFGIWQRGTSIAVGITSYWADRWTTFVFGAIPTGTLSRQTFTPGAAPVAGIENQFFGRVNVTAHNNCTAFDVYSPIEDVRTFAGQTATLSFYAKADAATTLTSNLYQNFGSGGSGTVQVSGSTVNLTTSWQRFSVTVNVPAISGKTIGSNSYLQVSLGMPLSGGFVRLGSYDIFGCQLEYGSKATPFQTATGTLQGELAACQRYLPAVSNIYSPIAGYSTSTTNTVVFYTYPVTPRVVPTGITVSSASHFQILNGSGTTGTPTAIAYDSFNTGINAAGLNVTSTAGTPTLVAGQGGYIRIVNGSGSILFTGCEL